MAPKKLLGKLTQHEIDQLVLTEAEIGQLANDVDWKPLGNQRAAPFLDSVQLLTEYAKLVDSARDGISAKAAFQSGCSIPKSVSIARHSSREFKGRAAGVG